MAGKATTFAGDLLKLTFQAIAIANIADNAVTSPGTTIIFSLNTADPGPAGTLATSEISYTGYTRGGVTPPARSSGGFTLSAGPPAKIELVANLDFGAMTAGAGGTVTFSGLGTNQTTTKLLYSGAVSPSIVVANGVTPRLTGGAGNTQVTEI